MSKHSHNAEILSGIPRGNWADMWATEQEEKGRSFSGQELTSIAPKTPPWAKKWGKMIADKIVELNGKSLEELYEMAVDAGYPHGREGFGVHLGMQAAGHGVSYSDDSKLSDRAIKLPRHEFYR